MFITPAFAQATGGAGGGGFLAGLFPFILIIIIFYFFLIRPQQKRMKQHREMVSSVARGDTVVTQGGIVGKVVRVQDNELDVEISEGVKVKVVKSTLADVRGKDADQKAPAEKPAKKDKKDK